MSFSATRLTLYAILSAIEEDLRDLIVTNLVQNRSAEELFGPDLSTRCLARYQGDTGIVSVGPTTDQLLPYLDFADTAQMLNRHRGDLPAQIAQYIREITPKLEKLSPIRNRVMHSRPISFEDLPTSWDVAEEFEKSEVLSWPSLTSTLVHLRQEPSFVLGLKIPVYGDKNRNIHNLPTPDFDETGFLGRRHETATLLSACQGAYPVISILAEGGVGKTALALKVAYDILDLENHQFDAIVWHSSKTAILTPNEIKRIETAIDSLGVFQVVSEHLAGDHENEPVEEVLSYLRNFKILLILDNLETVLDERIRGFLERLSSLPAGSKVLITSRIGFGAYDYPLKLGQMETGEAIQLMRALARIRRVEQLMRLPNDQLARYCEQMRNNPGHLKWFVSAIQTGKRPEEILANPEIFLDFCMENVYRYLSDNSRRVLKSMLVVPGKHSQAELSFLNETAADELSVDVQQSILELLTTNMVVMSNVPVGTSLESQYELSDLAREYLSRQNLVSNLEYQQFNRLNHQLIAREEQSRANLAGNILSRLQFTTRSRSEIIVSEYLRDAIRQAEAGNIQASDELIRNARTLAPHYFEVRRVEAYLKDKQGNPSAARDSYEGAVDLESGSLPLRYWYGSFLLRSLNDAEAALEQFQEAAKINPLVVDVQIEMARAHMWLLRFDEARVIMDQLLTRTDLSAMNARILNDLQLQFLYRKADHLLSVQHDERASIDTLVQLQSTFLTFPLGVRDERMRPVLVKAIAIARACQSSGDDYVAQKAREVLRWLETEVKPVRVRSLPTRSITQPERMQGIITDILQPKGFGFLRTTDMSNLFFHRSAFQNPGEWSRAKVGDTVTFSKGTDRRRRPCAINMQLAVVGDQPSSRE